MIATGAKLWFAICALAVAAAVAYNISSSTEWFGTFVLGSMAACAGLLGGLSLVTRDGDGPAFAAESPVLPTVVPRRSLPAPWPVLAAVGIGVAIIGLASGSLLLWAGLGVLALITGEWLVQGWAEGISADDAANQDLRNRLMFPLEIPVTAALVVGFVVISFSRVLLALPKNASTVVAIVVAASILGVASLIAAKPRLSSSVVSAVIAIGVVTFLVVGIVSGVSGHRTFHKEKDEGIKGASAHVQQSVASGQETNSR